MHPRGAVEVSVRDSWQVSLAQGVFAAARMRGRQTGAAATSPDWQLVWKLLVPGQDWEPNKISQDLVLAENDCLCGQLPSQLAE